MFKRESGPASKGRAFFVELGFGLALALILHSTGHAQVPFEPPAELWDNPAAGRAMANAMWSSAETADSALPSRTPRIRMFGMLPGFLSDPPGFGISDDPDDISCQTGGDGGL